VASPPIHDTVTVVRVVHDTVPPIAPAPTPPPVVTPPVSAADSTQPELPRVFLDTRVASTPSNGRTLHVNGDLQAALDSSAQGDVIVADTGAVFRGNFTIPAKAGGAGQWITVMCNCALPPEGTRMTPRFDSTTHLPKILTTIANAAITTAPGSARWRFIGIEVTADTALHTAFPLISLGNDNGAQTLANIPTDIIFDRVYVHGHPTLDFRRCFALNGAREAVIDSYVSECHGTSDAQAIAGWNGPGPYKIVNNYLEASTEVIAFGGADPSIANVSPADLEIRHNHITRPMSWKGGPWLEKNIIEFKHAVRAIIDGNVLENAWLNGQVGFAVLLWSVDQNGGCHWCVTRDITVSNNLIRNVTGAFNLGGRWDTTTALASHIAIRNNVIIGLDAPDVLTPDGNGRVYQILQEMDDLTIEHNTGFSPTSSSVSWDPGPLQLNQVIRNNVMGGPSYTIFASAGQDNDGWKNIGGPGSIFAGNVIMELPNNGGSPIPNNFYVPDFASIGLAGGAPAATSLTAQLADLALSSASPFKGKATDGKDPGADIAAVIAAIAGVIIP
jgi:hypothetical protein